MSINQLAAQIKLMESWKSINIAEYPVQMEDNQLRRQTNRREVRTSTIKRWKEDTKVTNAKESFLRDAAQLWNAAPDYVTNAKSLYLAKKEIVKYCKTLAI